jgi:hypothetical protein
MTTRLFGVACSCSASRLRSLSARAFLDQPDRGHLRHGLRYLHLGAGERLVAAAEQVQGTDNVGAYSQRDGAHDPEARTGNNRRLPY